MSMYACVPQWGLNEGLLFLFSACSIWDSDIGDINHILVSTRSIKVDVILTLAIFNLSNRREISVSEPETNVWAGSKGWRQLKGGKGAKEEGGMVLYLSG